MAYHYLEENISDVGFEAHGETLEKLFRESWRATLELMVADSARIRPRGRREITCEDPSEELVLFDLLGELIYLKDAEGALYRLEQIDVSQDDSICRAVATVVGEPIDQERHELGVDLKAVTFDQLAVRHDAAGYHARVVLDM